MTVRLASVLFGFAVVASTGACEIDAQTKDRFTEPNFVRTDLQPWAGETISIDIEGTSVAVDGGIKVIADPTLANNVITATARFAARADTDDKESADDSIVEAQATFLIARLAQGQISILCSHGTSHGTSIASESGCEYVEIHVPIGTPAQKLNINAKSGNGLAWLVLDPATIGNISVEADGADCDIQASLPNTPGGVVSLVSDQGGALSITLPNAFSADKVTITADPSKSKVGPFTDLTHFDGTAQAQGSAGAGLASLNLVSTAFAGETGGVTLAGE